MISVTIYGSCVSRDTLRISGEGFKLDSYFARSSWISAAGPPVRKPSVAPRLKSAFQERMLYQDFDSTILAALARSSSDLILLDLIDERSGVLPVVSGGFVTRLAEQKRSGWLDHTPHSRVLEFGTDSHFEKFSQAASKVAEALDSKTILMLQPRFASHAIDNTPFPLSLGFESEKWDEMYERYYDFVRQLGFAVALSPEDLCVTTSSHTWGAAQYHFIDDFYHWAAGEARSAVATSH